MPATLTTRARAKVNLNLRVIGRRADGYHELESLVAFAGIGDTLTLEPAPELGLDIGGPRGEGLEADDRNLVLRAARALADEIGPLRWGRFHLVKRLPIASGIGGGSADAAAALRLLARLNGLAIGAPELRRSAIRVGADVLVCLESRARVMAGIGDRLGPPLTLPPLFALLVNPRIGVATVDVFRMLGLAPGELHAVGGQDRREGSHWDGVAALTVALQAMGNDLEAPAWQVAPAITTVLERLASLPGCRLARMSGSGATCFALFDDCRASAEAAKLLVREQPGWWIKSTVIR